MMLNGKNTKKTYQGDPMKKICKVMSTAAFAAMLLGGTALGYADAAAEKTSASSNSAQIMAAASAISVTQSGITLRVTKAVYDGNHVSITIQRSGKGYTGGITGGKLDSKTNEYVREKGSIRDMSVLIDGKSIHGSGSLSQRPSLSWKASADLNTAIITLTDASQLGGNIKAFPDKFKLTATVNLEGVGKPFTLDIPLQNGAGKPVVLKLNITKKSNGLSMTLNKATITSTSTRLQLILKGSDKNSISFDVVDHQGKQLNMISGRGTDENNKKGDYYYDILLDGLGKNVNSFTIKPFKPELKDGASDQYKVDSKGNIIKQYMKDIEIRVLVK
ncbi:DUF5643 domain-containing protein [Paenibacillus lautus]|uniref:DUF5643 domain-containing protein n=1 Tax=Paenibacillus lautus TaxID=1401 RepID=UPI002DB81935|nr:DUF5643 domain-containing protein [Paenibacillus lautus]MEC0258921.1 DUF5643 domain-containing protein [Paenibacillus lautus]